jgi:hypothetical protein
MVQKLQDQEQQHHPRQLTLWPGDARTYSFRNSITWRTDSASRPLVGWRIGKVSSWKRGMCSGPNNAVLGVGFTHLVKKESFWASLSFQGNA